MKTSFFPLPVIEKKYGCYPKMQKTSFSYEKEHLSLHNYFTEDNF